jgi:hypothetical protein
LRKGTVFIFTSEYPSDYYLHYLVNELPREINKKVIKEARYMSINGYDIKLMKYPDYKTRGYRPELIYFIGNTVNYNGNIVECDRAKKQIEFDTKYKSMRKEPIRYINEAEEIDLREFIDDNYSLLKCTFNKLKWKDRFRYIWLNIRNKLRKV